MSEPAKLEIPAAGELPTLDSMIDSIETTLKLHVVDIDDSKKAQLAFISPQKLDAILKVFQNVQAKNAQIINVDAVRLVNQLAAHEAHLGSMTTL